ncbi:MAG: energy transducer TonB, partial [Arachidicoccus sp.]
SANGAISEVRALMGPTPDFGIAAEAIRVIEQGPKWTPAIQNGRYVAFRQTQRIIFQVQDN